MPKTKSVKPESVKQSVVAKQRGRMTKKKNKQNLTLRQARLLQELPKSASVAEAGERAGYAHRQDAHRALKGIAERAPEVLERLGLTIDYVADKCLRPLLEAKEMRFFAKDGIVVETREVEDLEIRIRAIDLWGRMMGAFTAQKVHLSGDLNLDYNHVSDEELDRRIAALLTQSHKATETPTPGRP